MSDPGDLDQQYAGQDGEALDLSILDKTVEEVIQGLFATGKMVPADLSQPVVKSLASFDKTSALHILDAFARKDLSQIFNKSGFIIGMMKRYRQQTNEVMPKIEMKPEWATLPEVSSIRCNRDTLQRWLAEADFEGLVTGCVVRLLVGEVNSVRLYRLCVVGGFQDGEAYKFGKTYTTKQLLCKFGNIARAFKMDYISNSDFTEEEFNDWLIQMQATGQEILTKKDVQKKIKKFKKFVLAQSEKDEKKKRSRSKSSSDSSDSDSTKNSSDSSDSSSSDDSSSSSDDSSSSSSSSEDEDKKKKKKKKKKKAKKE